jgi:hypothetical protein
LGSPSKLTEKMGEWTGEGMAIGLKNSLGQIKDISKQMADASIPDEINVNGMNGNASMNGAKQMTVNIHSPKALDVRQATREFNKISNKMALMW